MHVITGFLWDNCVKTSTSRCNDLGGVPACWTWIPQTILMMHEITVCVVKVAVPAGLGSPYRTMGRTTSKYHDQRVDLHQWQSGFPQGR